MKKHRPPRFDKFTVALTILFVSAVSSHALDLDGDGMSDVWQRIDNIATGDTASDIDGDGQSNGKEAEAGTDPRDSNDYFRTFDFSVNSTLDEVSLSWRSVEERYYEIEQSTDLVSWDFAAYGYGAYEETTTSTTFTPYPSGQSKMFFRVRGYPEYDYDYDGDGLQSWEERLLGTDPYDYDGDTDNDGMDDGFEFIHDFDPLSAADAQQDADGDLLSNAWEAALGLNPRLTDSDGNGISDANEDRDFDGLGNLAELQTHGTNPAQPDTDLDGLFDGWEIANGFDPLVDNTTDGNPNNDPGADPDGDGLTNSQEADHGTSASSTDSDGDGVSDSAEVGQGSNPTDPNDSQPPPAGTVAVNITFGDDSGSHSEKYRVRLVPLEGDTTGNSQRFRTNREYGVPQTDTFRLPKGSKYRVELLHVATDPDYDYEPKPDYDYVLEVDTSQGCLVLEDPDGISGYHYESDTFFADGKNASIYVPLFEWVTPKESPVSSPNDSGDGRNEFTYSTASPGVLTIDLKVLARPTGVAGVKGHDGVKFSDRCVFTLPSIGGSTFAWDGANSGGKSQASGEHLIAKATYTTLPASNSEFGLKQAKFQCDSDTSVLPQGPFEVFFPKDADNHPEYGPYPIDRPPNWFYYWRGGGVCGIPSDAQYDASASFGYTRPGVDSILRLGPLAPATNSGPETFTGASPYGSVTVTGTGKGIQCVAETVAHEVYHLTLYNALAGRMDGDGDGIADADEGTLDGINSNSADPDTFNLRSIFPGYSAYGDNEVRCRKKELSPGITVLPAADWANPGCQSVNQFGPTP